MHFSRGLSRLVSGGPDSHIKDTAVAAGCKNPSRRSRKSLIIATAHWGHAIGARVRVRRSHTIVSSGALGGRLRLKIGIGLLVMSLTASIYAPIFAHNSWLGGGRSLRGTVFDAAAQAIEVAFSNKHILIGFMKFNDRVVHAIDGLLECLEIAGHGHDVTIERGDFEFVVMEVIRDRLLVSLILNGFADGDYVELCSNLNHSSIPD